MKTHRCNPILRLVVGLLMLVLAASCSHDKDDECQISCSDGFKTTKDGKCSADDRTNYNALHGSCTLTTILCFCP
jgi:hypothetical protein